jgi:hypothetical protein
MTSWLVRQLNLGDDFVGHLDEARLAFQHPRLLVAGLVLLLPAAVFIYLRQRRNLPSVPTGLRFTLTATRVLILLLLVLILGSPILKLDHKGEKKPIVALLFDHSQSMLQLPVGPLDSEAELTALAGAAGYAKGSTDPETRRALVRMSRAKLAQSVANSGALPFLQGLSKKFDVQFYSFARDVTRLGVDPAHPRLPEPPAPGSPGTHATHIGDAVAKVLDEAAGRHVAGILVFSDGQNTGGRSPGAAARAAAGAGAPLFTVPVGSPKRLRDVAIVDLFATGQVTLGDTARVAVTLESSGFDRRPVKVELKDGDELLASKDVTLRDAEQQQVELTFKATKAGARYLTVQVPPQPEEPDYLRGNNSDTAFVRVSKDRLKVLFVEGLPRWDFRFLKNALRRDNGIGGRTGNEVDLRLEAEWRRRGLMLKARRPLPPSAGDLPSTLDQLAEYHTVILGDVSPRMLRSDFLDLLVKAVREKGVGLVVAAGPLAMPHRFDARLHDLLPVRLERGVPGRYPRGIPSFAVELSPEGSVHEATRFYDDPGRNHNAWAHLPRSFWCAAAERPAPGATVLAWNPVRTAYGKVPLLAHHYAGQGRVLFVGTDSTWLWRQNVGDRFFYRFWGQAVRFVARREAKGGKRSWLEVRPLRAQPGERASVELLAFGPDGAPRTEPKQIVQVAGGGGASAVELTADPAVKGRYTGSFVPKGVGEHRITYGEEKEPIEARLRVSVAPEELRQPNVNRLALTALASASGGQMVELPELASIADKLTGESKYTELHREASLWDNWLTLAVLIFLYTLDVGLRRLLGLS